MIQKTTIYQLKDVEHFYGTKKVLDIKSLEILNGSIIGLIGPNGSGKTSLLKLLAFIHKPTRGNILYNGRPEVPFSQAIRSKITLLTQKPYLLKRSVYDNIAYGLKIRKDTSSIKERIKTALSHVGLEYDYFAQRMWHELSGGEAQRVALAARLILKPDVLLLDEPITSVDTKSATLIRKASLKARDDWGTTLVIASHDLSWLFSVTDQQVSLLDGKLFSTGIENIIPGPFNVSKNHLVTKTFYDGQTIYLNPPVKSDSTAIIKKNKIKLSLEKQAELESGLNQIWGQLISMHLEEKNQRVLVKINVQDLTFELSLTQDQIDKKKLSPGKRVNLLFKADDIEWI